MSEQYVGPQWVGIDLHPRRSMIVRMSEEGETLETIRIVHDPERKDPTEAAGKGHARQFLTAPRTGGQAVRPVR